MTSGLNPYQIAVLQEMGICVWQSQAVSQTQATSAAGNSHTAEQTPSGAAVPSQSSGQPAVNGQARIAQLRSMLGNKPDKKPSAPEKVQDNEAKPASPVVETIDPRSFGTAGQDILQALSLFHDAKSVRWQYGSELSLKNNILSLPYKTAPSDAAEKRRLWQIICTGQQVMPSFTLQPLSDALINDAHAIHQQATYNPWSLSTFADCLTPPYAGLALLNSELNLTGYAVILLVAGEATLMDIAVAVSDRGQGAGKQLLDGVIAWCRQQQAESLWLEVRAGNHKAISLYEKAGFEDIEVRKNYYPCDGGKEDARIMRMLLVQGVSTYIPPVVSDGANHLPVRKIV